MKDSYSNLCVFNYGKHSYVVMKSSDKVMYFESVNGKYIMPITNFSLYDNEGKSLTLVNQHFFMNQLVNRLNVALKKGYFSNEQDIVKYLNNLKSNSENDVNLNKLFKGSFMNEIDEKNFESNKREILKYLDNYRFDTFESYNNVSIFNGSLEKGSVENSDNNNFNENFGNDGLIDGVKNSDDEILSFDDLGESSSVVSDDKNNLDLSTVDSVGDGFDFNAVKSTDSNEFVNSNDYFNSLGNNNPQEQVNNVVSGINSNDYFNFDNNSAQNNVVDSVLDVAPDFQSNDNFNQDNVVSNQVVDNSMNENIVSEFQTNNSLNNVQSNDSFVSAGNINDLSNDISTNLENPSFVSDSSNSDPFSLSNSMNSNVSYIDQVKDRMSGGYSKPDLSESQNNVEGPESFGFSSSGIVTGDSVISDNSELPELEQISSDPVSDNVVEKKKSHIGIIIFMILLVLALGALSFYLYSYVF